VAIREVANKHCSFSFAFSTNSTMTSYPSDIKIKGVNNSKIRRHSASPINGSLKDSLVLSNISSRPYHKRMKINNELPEVDSIDPIDSSQLSYTGTAKISSLVSQATDKKAASNSQCINDEVPTLKKEPKLHTNGKSIQIEGINTIPSEYMSDNMQISYNANQAVDSES